MSNEQERRGISRGEFFRRSGAAAAGIGLAGAGLSGCAPGAPPQQTAVAPVGNTANPSTLADRYSEVPAPPDTVPNRTVLQVLSPEEATFVDALTARIIPGDAADPGAHEADVVTYIDRKLAFRHGDVEPTYRKPPFARAYTTAAPPATDTVNGYRVVWVAKDELPRHGYQSQQTPLESYRLGLAATDAYAKATFGKPFVQLSADQQDTIIADLASGKATGFTDPTAQDFFLMLRTDTIEGMFCDPLYGGNRDLVGWKLVGYPGAQRAYTQADMLDPQLYRKRPPQSLASMMPFNPGQYTGPGEIMPVAGSRQKA